MGSRFRRRALASGFEVDVARAFPGASVEAIASISGRGPRRVRDEAAEQEENVLDDIPERSSGNSISGEDMEEGSVEGGAASEAEDGQDTAEEGDRSGDYGEEVDEGDDNEDRLLCAATVVVLDNIPLRQLEHQALLAQSLCEGAEVVTPAALRRYLQEVDAAFHLQTHFWCRCCGGRLPNTTAPCGNPRCRMRSVPIRSWRDRRWTCLTTVDIVTQVRSFVQRYVDVIIRSHEEMERGGETLSELYMWPMYRDAIETQDERRRRTLRISLVLNTDGYNSPGHTRASVWPTFLLPVDVPLSVQKKVSSLILASVFYGAGTPSQQEWTDILRRAVMALRELRDRGIEVIVRNEIWTVFATVRGVCADLAAQKSVFWLRGWQSAQGCQYCVSGGRRVGVTAYWPFDDAAERRALFTAQDTIASARRGDDGFVRPTRIGGPPSPILEFCLPHDVVPDALHLIQHGWGRDLVRDMVADPPADCRRPMLRLQRRLIQMWSDAFTQCRLPHGSVRSLADFRTMTASDMHLVLCLPCAIGSLHGAFDSPVDAALVFLLCYSYRLLTDASWTGRRMRLFRRICDFLKAVWEQRWGLSTCTMKAHIYLQHVPVLLDAHGSPTLNSAATFEAGNRALEVDISAFNTRGIYKDASLRLLRRTELLRRVAARAPLSHHPPLLQLHRQYNERPAVEGARVVDGFLFQGSDARLLATLPDNISRAILQRHGTCAVYYGKVTRGDEVFTSAAYQETQTQRRLLTVRRRGGQAVVEASCYLHLDGQALVCGTVWRTSPAHRRLTRRLMLPGTEVPHELEELLNVCCVESPYYFVADLAPPTEMIFLSCRSILGYCCAAQLGDVVYVADLRCLRVHS